MVTVPAPGTLKFVALYWSPCACRPTTIGLVQPGTIRGTFEITIGSRKITPPRMLRIVPRSEERRVGKEGGSRWLRDYLERERSDKPACRTGAIEAQSHRR